jgi:hypothetical protein
MSASTSAFGRAASCSSKEAVTLFALLLFARPDPVDLVDQPLPRIVTRIFSRDRRFADSPATFRSGT